MRRRSFIGSLLAIIPAALVFPRIPKPAPEGIPCTIFTPPTIITGRAGMDLEIGDPVFINMNGKIEKYTLKQGNRVLGIVTNKSTNLSNGKSEIKLGGIK